MSNLIKLKHTKALYFDQARYFLEDEAGGKILVVVDYKKDKFELKTIKNGHINFSKLEKDAGKFAKDLLARKAKVNIMAK